MRTPMYLSSPKHPLMVRSIEATSTLWTNLTAGSKSNSTGVTTIPPVQSTSRNMSGWKWVHGSTGIGISLVVCPSCPLMAACTSWRPMRRSTEKHTTDYFKNCPHSIGNISQTLSPMTIPKVQRRMHALATSAKSLNESDS